MPSGGSKFNVQEFKDRKMGNFHVLVGKICSDWIARCAGVFIFQPKVERPEAN